MNFVNVLDVANAANTNPDTVVDWTSLLKDAIKKAVDEGHAGVLVPARAAPYPFTDSGGANMSIDLRGVHNFVLLADKAY